jgi:methylmalonyl-CoA mutase N-terminal domain/subunit
MWAKITKSLGATEPKAQQLRFHSQTGGSTLTAQQPLNNVIRVGTQALAAVLGGTQSLHTNGYDEALSLPTEEAAKIALRTQQIIAYETGVVDTVDPLAGSFFIENLTDEMEKAAFDYLDQIDAMGGAVVAIENGFIQNEISNAAYQYQLAVESGKQIVVGVNRFVQETESIKSTFRVDDSIRLIQIEKIKKLKKERSAEKVETSLAALEKAARSKENMMPFILEAVKSYATIGEITNILRKSFGEYRG